MTDRPTSEERAVLTGAYAGFNVRDIDSVLALMAKDVVWPNGMEGVFTTPMTLRQVSSAGWRFEWVPGVLN